MSDIVSMQQLMGSTQGLKNAIEATTRMHITSSPSRTGKTSRHDLRFAQLKTKYSVFATNFGVELDGFIKSLSSSIRSEQLLQEQERKRLEEAERERLQNQERERLMELKSEIRSNSNPTNLEMEDNVSEMTYSSASSVKEPSVEPTKPEPEPVPVEVYSNPKPSYPAKQTKKTKKKKAKQPKKNAKIIVRETALVEPAEPVQEEEEKVEPYKYEADKVNWSFDGVQRHSTMIFIGNLPNHIKVAAVQFFVMKKAKVTMRQIEETQVKFGARGKYALVRFRSDVLMSRVNAFVNGVNTENNELFEKQKKGENGMSSNKSQKRVSWQKRVFLKFNTMFKYFESEQAMYQDPTARHKVFLRNFDILNEECHKKLTYALLDCGDLARDITIRVDRFGDPYCVATFKNIEDAIYCCNSEIVFEGRVLEMKYDKQ